MRKALAKKLPGFTLLEMLVVLFIISLLLLLFVPKLINQKDAAQKKSDAAIVKVVETQIQVFELDHGHTPTKEELIGKDYVDEKQYAIYEKTKKE
ncbi:competence type IV pilus major pilin ComGC [Enterococcus viikkiensis]|uniref:Competence type IV pilus major pilin ComGC n=1 Tax=Enterococcus viikkiensis TaxID=930854 RepID=A0ABU3FRR5_9ENTE|nr:competence type IV pilus major pilin ComGC [Enterococcus viikkiensis]MDT2827979.1 competence type IV pilus major pilin ComGC [Enterococcus viikkiensis]